MTDRSAVHQSVLVVDAHADIVTDRSGKMYLDPDGTSKVDPAKMRSGGVDAVVMSIAVGPGPRTADGDASARREADRRFEAVTRLVGETDGLVFVRSAAELAAAHANGHQAILLSFQNARILGADIGQLDHWYDVGCRMFALTHMGHNDFSDSSRPVYDAATGKHEPDEEHGGLSDLGRAAIDRIVSLGGLVDVSQLSTAATMQTLERCPVPVIASHSNVRAISNVRRNLTDTEIDAIAANGGVICVSTFHANLLDFSDPELGGEIRRVRREASLPEEFDYPYELYWELSDREVRNRFLSSMTAAVGLASVDDIVDHIDHLVARVGIDHVGFGSDFNHGSGMVDGFSNAAEAPNLTAAMLGRGYSPADVEQFWGGNMLRVLAAAEEGA